MKASLSENATNIISSTGGLTMVVIGFVQDNALMILGVLQFVIVLWFQWRKDQREKTAAEAAMRLVSKNEELADLAIEEKKIFLLVEKLRSEGRIERRRDLRSSISAAMREGVAP